MLVRYRLAILAAATLACADPAHAATLVNSGGTLTYTAAARGFSDVSIAQNPAPDMTVHVERNGGDSDAITPAGCTADGDVFICPGVSTVVMDLGDADDYVEVVRMRAAIMISGGVGDDALYTDIPGVSTLDGGPGADYAFAGGPAADTINGGDGDDIVGFVPYDSVTHGADVVNGGPGLDEGRVEAGHAGEHDGRVRTAVGWAGQRHGRSRRVLLLHETAEKVRARLRRPVSRQHICFDRCSEGRSAAVWTSRFCVDRIAADEIDFFSGLPHRRHDRRWPAARSTHRGRQSAASRRSPLRTSR